MSQPLAAVTLTPGVQTPIPCGNAPAVGAVVLYNESPYAIQVRAGSKGGWLPAWTGDRYDTGGDAAWDGTVVVTPQAIASNTGQAPSFSILPVIYGSGEPVPGTYPASLTRQVVQGQIVTSVTQVIQDGQATAQTIVESTPTGVGQTILLTTDGKLALKGTAAILQVVPNTASALDDVIRIGPDPHSLADWYFILDTNGDLFLWDNKNMRRVWTGRLSDAGVTLGGNLMWGLQHSAYAGLQSFSDANGAAATILSQQAGAATYLQFITWNGSAAASPLGLGTQATVGSYEGCIINDGGALAKVGNQPTVGNFGVPVIVAQTPLAGVNVTTTGVQTLFSFTPSANGLYELRGTFTQANGSASTYDFWMSYTDPVTGGNPKASLLTSQGGQALIGLAIGASTGTSIPCAPATGFNSGGHAILVQFNDHAGTPNDTVYAQLWRLS